MKNRAAVAAISIVLVSLLAAPAAAEPERATEFTWSEGYVGACLAESGLTLSDDTPLRSLEARPSSGSSLAGDSGTKNPMVAMLLSCLIPGWGEIYAGDPTRGRWFMAAEAAIWTGYGTFRVQESLRKDDYEEYARIFAGASEGADSDYLSDIGDYIRSEGDDSYNESVRRDARSLFPGDLEAQAAYVTENGYHGELAWDWGTKDKFYEYVGLRKDASRSDRNAFYMTGLAILNRAFSAIDGAWMARRYNAGIHGEPGARLSVVPQVSDGDVGARATLEVSF